MIDNSFERNGRLKVQGRVYSLPVVKDFDVFEDALLGFLVRFIVLHVDEFNLQRFEKRFHGGIVIAITFGTHAGFDAMF